MSYQGTPNEPAEHFTFSETVNRETPPAASPYSFHGTDPNLQLDPTPVVRTSTPPKLTGFFPRLKLPSHAKPKQATDEDDIFSLPYTKKDDPSQVTAPTLLLPFAPIPPKAIQKRHSAIVKSRWRLQAEQEGEELTTSAPWWRFPLVLVLCGILLIAGFFVVRQLNDKPVDIPQQTITVGTTPLVNIQSNGGGQIFLHSGQTGSIEVKGSRHASGFLGNIANATLELKQKGSELDILTGGQNSAIPLLQQERVDLDITLPSNCTVQITHTNGSITIDGLQSQITVTTQSSDIDLTNVTLKGQSTLKTTDGDITIKGALDPNGNYQLYSESGSIDLTLPAESTFALQAEAKDEKEVYNDFASTNAAHPRIQASAPKGSISLHKQNTHS
uniref:DUF4097 domain-containing protein n=1 Tax=Thermosporothrix sp. COM3 TaxID=2490863 RepID=A0A455SDF8_9CHLR|nr:hypothetical protein KTC_05470 [Thermosporothrix sp. COM3]